MARPWSPGRLVRRARLFQPEVIYFSPMFQPDVILSAATAGRGTLRRLALWMAWMGMLLLPAAQALLASVQPMSGLRKVPPERLARSCDLITTTAPRRDE